MILELILKNLVSLLWKGPLKPLISMYCLIKVIWLERVQTLEGQEAGRRIGGVIAFHLRRGGRVCRVLYVMVVVR